MKILNLDPINYSSKALDIIKELGIPYLGCSMSRSNLIANINQCSVIILRFSHIIDKEVIDSAKQLRYIVTNATGADHIDVEYAKSKGIVTLCLKDEVDFLKEINASAEHTWALLMALMRKIPSAVDDVKNGFWRRDNFLGSELNGKTLGIIGLGRNGLKIAKYGKAFNMNVIGHDLNVYKSRNYSDIKYVEEEYLLKKSDVISLHLPLNSTTKNYFSQKKFNLLKPSCYLINTSRGAICDEEALLKSLLEFKLAGAALDVLTDEGSENILKSRLYEYSRNHQNLIITPHIGGATNESWEKTEIFMAKKLYQKISENGL